MSSELNIALIQTSLFWESPQKNLEMFSKKIESISEEVDLIILPEMFTSGFTMTPNKIEKRWGNETTEWMKKVAFKKNAALVGSLVFQENHRYYNRLLFVEPDGKITSYDKRHTFTLAGEDKIYTSGKDKALINYKGFTIFPLICYDLRFPVWSRNVEGYDVLIYVANWPKPRIKAWDSLLCARAIENMSYCVGVNRVGEDNSGHQYSGHSAIYNTLGERVAFSDKETILTATLKKSHIEATRDKLKFLDDKDSFSLLS